MCVDVYIVTLQPRSLLFMAPFRGFLIQARLAADNTTVVGSFASPNHEDNYQLSSCARHEVRFCSYDDYAI